MLKSVTKSEPKCQIEEFLTIYFILTCSGVDLGVLPPPLIFAEIRGRPLIFAETGCLPVCRSPGALRFSS